MDDFCHFTGCGGGRSGFGCSSVLWVVDPHVEQYFADGNGVGTNGQSINEWSVILLQKSHHSLISPIDTS